MGEAFDSQKSRIGPRQGPILPDVYEASPLDPLHQVGRRRVRAV